MIKTIPSLPGYKQGLIVLKSQRSYENNICNALRVTPVLAFLYAIGFNEIRIMFKCT